MPKTNAGYNWCIGKVVCELVQSEHMSISLGVTVKSPTAAVLFNRDKSYLGQQHIISEMITCIHIQHRLLLYHIPCLMFV